MRPLLALMFVVLVAVALSACGEVRRAMKTTSYMNTPQAKLGGATPAAAAAARNALLKKVAWVHSTSQPPLPNDGDHDEPGDEDHDNNRDTGNGPGSIDPYVDYLPPANNRAYHDEDDELSVEWGRPVSPQDLRAVAAAVERYYAAAAAGDAARACSMLTPSFARGVPVDYGKFGPSFVRGAKTCAGVLSLLFRHYRRELSGTVQVTDVRVNGSTALAFIGSETMRAAVISLHREGGSWTISQLIGSVLL